MDIYLRPCRSLTHALGMRLFYRVRLCLDGNGIPDHAWMPDTVERVIGNRCVLHCINTDLVQLADTRHIDVWTWTANPSDTPKRVWLIFTHKPSDKSSEMFVTQVPLEVWNNAAGISHEVFIHMQILEDYSAAHMASTLR